MMRLRMLLRHPLVWPVLTLVLLFALDIAHRPGFLSITLPFLAPTIAITVLLRTVWISNFADLIVVMTGGGPADRTQIVASYIFTQAFKRLDFGYASAIALVLLALLLAYSMLIILLRQTLLNKD